MGFWDAIATSVNGTIQGATNLTQTLLNDSVNKKNLQFQKDVFNYQKQLQREIFQREDNAIQRRSADIAAAGGNPAMAWETGQGASAGSAVPVEAPQQAQYDFAGLMNSSLSQVIGGMSQFKDMELKDAQIRSINQDISHSEAEVITEQIRQLQLQMVTAKTKKEKDKLQSEIDTLNWNLEMSKQEGLKTTDSKNYLYNTAEAFFNKTIPDNISDLKATDIVKIAAEVGLGIILPGWATMKLGSKAIGFGLKILKKKGLPKSEKEFIEFFKTVTDRMPSPKEIKSYFENIAGIKNGKIDYSNAVKKYKSTKK